MSVAAINSVQQAAKMGLQGNSADANKYLLSTKKFFENSAVSALQQEEYSIWKNDYFSDLSSVLRKNVDVNRSKMSDESAKVLYKMKAANLVGFLSGEKKRVIVTKRKNHVHN